ncbi:metallophosphoesterase [Pseudonocardia dioxanivorans CB1190]|uniref:Metallophosphoesterase n=1 Tax=Pseudonocardia dioxanivorans (strain ATCC 55486 / DSM 44775 / JCM 13855 / CB1190) TaxID=675635 RepID=F4CL39_PSEUX|nr:metallophosphoesterase [Pseudonocardia dioxanivorans]AEA24968.1 metallophosphoesterase [Pseudonocardia dioxanivorans CB1190]
MRVHVVSDVHGDVEGLARAGEGADALVVLGDLIDFIDYADPTGGIVGTVLGADVSAELARLRRSADRHALRAYATEAWKAVGNPRALVEEAVAEQYARLFAVLPAPTWAIPGNVDVPHLWAQHAGPHVHLPDGKVAEIGGLRFAFVGGAPLPRGVAFTPGPAWRPNLVSWDDYATVVDGFSAVDVLCSHVPPALPELAYDVVTRGPEATGPGLVEVIDRDRPRAALSGHVHQPLAQRVRRGRTECVNVGYFRRRPTPYVLRW